MVKLDGKKLKKEAQANNNLTVNKRWKKKSSKKKKIGKDKSISAPADAPDPAATPLATTARASTSAYSLSGNGDSLQVKEKDKRTPEHPSGFIFMCNRKTKPQCFQFRVFGLPIGQKEVVERIKPGTKLFLFDVELKLLYGIYKATSEGKINLEPTAFEGKFPAQVKFKILNGCLPLPEKSFRKAIVDNYHGSKFSPELGKKHVKELMSLFRPLAASLPATSILPIHNALPPLARLPPEREDQYRPPTVYLSGMWQAPTQRMMEQHPAQGLQIVHQQHAGAALADQAPSAAEVQSFSIPNEQYYGRHSQPSVQDMQILWHQQLAPAGPTERASLELSTHAHFDSYSHPTYSSGSHALIVGEPSTRYHTLQERFDHTKRSGSDYHRLLFQKESETALQRESSARYSSQLPLLHHRKTALSRESATTYYPLPTTAPYTPSTVPTYSLASERREQNIPELQVPLTQERETGLSGRSIDAYYTLPTTSYHPSTVAGSYLADPYVPSTVAAYHWVPVEPHVPSTVAAYHSVPVEPYAPSTSFQTDLTASYGSSSVRSRASMLVMPELTGRAASYYSLAGPGRIIQ